MWFGEEVAEFLNQTEIHGLRYLMVGDGAVNFHGYQRHSADVYLWVEPSLENFDRLLKRLNICANEVNRLPGAAELVIKFKEQDEQVSFNKESVANRIKKLVV